MKMRSSAIIDSPARPGYVRLCAEVEYDSPGLKPETYWFEVHKSEREFLSTSGNPWLVCLSPVAITLQETLHINLPVDPALLKNTRELMRVWSFWFPRLKPMDIFTETDDVMKHKAPSRALSFFSGGVDAFFTALCHDNTEGPYDKMRIDDLVYVWGFDVSLSNGQAFEKLNRSLSEAASKMGKQLVSVATNLRETQLSKCDWEFLYHGPALASVVYILEKKYGHALIASSGGYRETFPHGSHPALMPLFSSSSLQVKQSGATFGRTDKIKQICRSKAAQDHLHVCFALGNEKNCGRCLKCFRALLVFDLLGVLNEFKTFDITNYDLRNAGKMFLWGEDDVKHAIEIRALALEKNRADVIEAMNKSVRHTARIRKQLSLLDGFKNVSWGKKFYDRVERRLLRGSVGGDERYHPESGDSLFVQYNRVHSV